VESPPRRSVNAISSNNFARSEHAVLNNDLSYKSSQKARGSVQEFLHGSGDIG